MKRNSLQLAVVAITLCTASLSWAQTEGNLLTYEDFTAIVKQHHPLAIQSELQLKRGDATLQMARGGFDPKIGTNLQQKYFKGDQYYSLLDAGLKVPTWFGIEINAGYEQNGGIYLGPENSTPTGGLAYAGLSLPVGRGLFIDERRAELRKAQIYQKSTIVEQRLMLNELLYEAGKAYWQWFEAYQVLNVFKEAIQLAEFRFASVKQEAAAGDKPAIDTLEAGIQLQNRQLALQQAQLDFKNSTAFISIYLWQQGQIPLEMKEGTTPVNLQQIQPREVDNVPLIQLDSLIANHPYLQQYRFKIDQLKIDRRLKQEQFKPQLDLKYNALNQVIGGNPFSNFSINNYVWGLQFNMPIPLRRERGAMRLANIKLQEADLQVKEQQATINYKINASLNDWETTRSQAVLYQRTVVDYAGLLEGERQKFSSGESSLFMVNAREIGYIETQLKYIALLTKNQKAALATVFSLGLLADE
jgi:outer membrane protein TolC